MFGADKFIGKLQEAVQGFELPKFGTEVEIPVYVVHNSLDAEDYFFIFDFEQFVEASRKGLFARPIIRVWAGRDDFARYSFARQFRESFAREFDIARAQLEAQGERKTGWFSFLINTFGEFKGASLGAFLSNLLLLVAMTSGKAVLSQVLPASWLGLQSDAQKLDDAISDTQTRVDAAIRELRISLHVYLMRHAYRDGVSGRRSGLERDAWQLPSYVRKHLNDGSSGAWW